MSWLILAVVVVLLVVIGALLVILPRRVTTDFKGAHVFITGGSKGIGKAVVQEVLKRGAGAVSIVARDAKVLNAVQTELKQLYSSVRPVDVNVYPLDVTAPFEQVQEVVDRAVEASGPINVLINNAGLVIQGGFDELDVNDFQKMMSINYLSAVKFTRAVLPGMKKLGTGHISFVSSAAGQCAIWGYSAYSPSKFAIRGFAEALHMEMLPFNIGVSILFPPNTDTDGFKEEIKTMPEEVKLISDSAGFFPAYVVAKELLKNIEQGTFATTIGLEGWMLGVLTAGAGPVHGVADALVQSTLGGIFRFAMLFFIHTFHSAVQKCHLKKHKS